MTNWRTRLAGTIAIIAGGYLIYKGQYELGIGYVTGGLAAWGLNGKAERIIAALKTQKP